MTAVELLEYLQSKCPYPKIDEEKMRPHFMKVQAQISEKLGIDTSSLSVHYQKIMSQLPTKAQNPLTYDLLKRIVDAFQELIKDIKQPFFDEYKIELRDFPVFGTISMGEFSAQAISDGNVTSSLILFSDGFFGFANLIGKVIATAFPIEPNKKGAYSFNKEKILEHISGNNLLIARFLDLTLAYMLCNNAHGAQQYIIEKEYFAFSEIIRDSFEYFVVAHEYAHFTLGHLSESNVKKLFSKENEDVEKIIFNWQQELDADRLGAMMTLNVMRRKGFDVATGGIGIWVCLNVLEILEKLENLLEEKSAVQEEEQLSPTHPPIALRKESFLQFLGDNNSKETRFDSIDFIFNALWKYFIRFFKALKQTLKRKNLSVKDIDYKEIRNLIYNFNFIASDK